MPKRGPDLAGEGRHTGLAVGAGHRDHAVGLGAEPQRGRAGQRRAGVFGQDQGHVAVGQHLGRKPGAFGIGQDRRRALIQRGGDKTRAMRGAARQGREQHARAHRAAVGGQARQCRVAPGAGGQPEVR